ncbi:ankyrin repeat domain-containing protein 50 [Microdochium nivale]|nr:ankyrin repeat domain-containing protein 50 [Microdochium nivale]
MLASAVAQQNPLATLTRLPPELAVFITRFLDIRDALAFAATCRHHHALLTDLVYTRQLRYERWTSYPMRWAVYNDVLTTADRCLRLGADAEEQLGVPELHEDSGQLHETALTAAILRDCLDMVQLLLGHGADPCSWLGQNSPFSLAVSQCNLKILNMILSSMPSPASARRMVNGRITRDGRTALHCAAIAGHDTMVQLLIDHGARLDARTGCGDTSLFEAALAGSASTVRLLLRAGADVWVTNHSGERLHDQALMATYESRKPAVEIQEVLEIVVSTLRQPLPHSTGARKYRLPLDDDATNDLLTCGWSSIVRLVLESGAPVDPRDEDDESTPLWHYAGLTKGSWEADMYGASAAERQDNMRTVICLLLDAGADANSRGPAHRDCVTPLMRAAKVDNLEIAKLLLVQGHADIDATDSQGRTAIDHGMGRPARSGHVVANYLVEHRDHDFSTGAP